MKKYFRFFGIAMMATALCVGMASCGDKDENDDSTEQNNNNGNNNQGGGSQGTINVNMQDVASWASSYQQFNYLGTTQDGYTFVYAGVFQQQNAWPAAIIRIVAENGAQSYGFSDLNCNYVEDGQVTLTGSDGSEVQVGSYTYFKTECGDINVSNVNANTSTLKATFTAVMPLLNTMAYFTGDETSQVIIKNMTVTYNNVSMTAPSAKSGVVADAASDVVWKVKK